MKGRNFCLMWIIFILKNTQKGTEDCFFLQILAQVFSGSENKVSSMT